MMPLLALLLLLLPSTPAATGSVSGRLTLWRNGAATTDASNAVVWIEGLRRSPERAVRIEMKSEKKAFTPRVIAVSRQGSVDFPNVDPIYHNVFSVSGANRFDLGLYRAGASKEKKFDEPGLVRVYCNIHPQMIGFVMVVDSDLSAVTGKDGAFHFDGVAAGPRTLRVWHEEGGETQVPIVVRAATDISVAARLDASGFKREPHKNKYGKDYPPQAGSEDERY